jgi:hypothetical protein
LTREVRRHTRSSSALSTNAPTTDVTDWLDEGHPPRGLIVSPATGRPVLRERYRDSAGDGQSPSPNNTEPIVTPHEIPPTKRFQALELTRARFLILGSWEGTVQHVGKDTFTAYIADIDERQAAEVAEFYRSDLSEEDSELLEEGAVFYWFVGYNDSASGQRSRSSVLRFRRLPPWTEYEDKKAHSWADETAEALSIWRD